MIVVHDDDAQSLGAEQKSVHWNDEMFADGFNAEVDLRVTAGEEFAVFVGNVDFGVESAAGEVDGVGGAHDFAFETAAGILDEFERGGEPCFDIRGVDFGDAHEGANRIGLREIEERLSGAAITRVDEVSGIDVALRELVARHGEEVRLLCSHDPQELDLAQAANNAAPA